VPATHDHDDEEQVGLLGHCHVPGTNKLCINTNSSSSAKDLDEQAPFVSVPLHQDTDEDGPRVTNDSDDHKHQQAQQQQQDPPHLGPIDALARSSTLRRYTAVLSFCLMSLVLTYTGASFAAGVLGGR
jgi:hypothetical protein